jgi:chromosome segregation ATPase
MRFISADISNYRLIKHLHIDFDKELTLVGGPNESGKSTVAEALHRVLFLKPRGQGALITAMKSEVHEGAPQVSLRFKVNGTEYLLSKKFGANGSIELSYGTSHKLQGEDAERRLSELLNTPMPTRNSEVMAKWSHLWIWQGESTTNPIGQIGEVSSKLEERLLEMASGISVRSDRDRILQEHFHMEADANYTQARNAIRAGSPLQLAKGRFEQLKESYDSALDKWQDLEALASRLPELEAEANRISIVLDTLHSEGKAVGERHETLTALNADRTAQETRSRQIVERLNLLREKDEEVRNLLASNDRLTNEIQPDELVLTEHEIEIKAKEHELGQAILYRDEMDRMLADFQQSIDLLRHLSDKMRCESGLNATEEAIRVLEGRETELDTVIGRLCKLPDMDQKKLTQLRSLHGRLLNAEAALNAIATEIQIEGFTGKAILEGEPMDDGQPYTITETSYIDLGGKARMRITPGGGTSLEEARKTERGLTREWHDAIQASGVESLEDAERKLYEINELKSTRKRLEAEISAGDLPGQRNKGRFDEWSSSLHGGHRIEWRYAQGEDDRSGRPAQGRIFRFADLECECEESE